jgi:hypothetical protein
LRDLLRRMEQHEPGWDWIEDNVFRSITIGGEQEYPKQVTPLRARLSPRCCGGRGDALPPRKIERRLAHNQRRGKTTDAAGVLSAFLV